MTPGRTRLIYAVFAGYLCDWVFGWTMLWLGRFTHDRTYQFYIAPGEWFVDPLRAPYAALLFWSAIFGTAWYFLALKPKAPAAPRDAAPAS